MMIELKAEPIDALNKVMESELCRGVDFAEEMVFWWTVPGNQIERPQSERGRDQVECQVHDPNGV
jgi:hypothetical protein